MFSALTAAPWTAGPGGFGTADTPGARVGTDWSGAEIWIRRRFELPAAPLGAEQRALLQSGANTLAVHCPQTGGGQFIDVGLAWVEEVER